MNKQSIATRLTIRNAEFYAYHGVKDEEQTLGGTYQVDADLYYNGIAAVLSDDVNDAVNYEEAMYCIDEIMNGDPINLIETLAHDILSALLDKFPHLVRATVRIRKMSVPIRHVVGCIEVEQSMSRE